RKAARTLSQSGRAKRLSTQPSARTMTTGNPTEVRLLVLSDLTRRAHEQERCGASLRFGFLLLLQPRHDLDEGARAVAIVQLILKDAIPGILAGAGRSRHAENVSAFGYPAAGSALHRRGADLLIAKHMEQRREAVDLLLEEWLHGVRRHIAPGEACAASGDHHVDLRILHPALHLLPDRLGVILDDGMLDHFVTGLLDYVGKQYARRVGLLGARV